MIIMSTWKFHVYRDYSQLVTLTPRSISIFESIIVRLFAMDLYTLHSAYMYPYNMDMEWWEKKVKSIESFVRIT